MQLTNLSAYKEMITEAHEASSIVGHMDTLLTVFVVGFRN